MTKLKITIPEKVGPIVHIKHTSLVLPNGDKIITGSRDVAVFDMSKSWPWPCISYYIGGVKIK